MNDPAADGRAVEEAKRRVDQAHATYQESRDLLARFLLSQEVSGAARPGPWFDHRSQVERLAYQLWEKAGRPTGRAEEHWYLAERLIRSAA